MKKNITTRSDFKFFFPIATRWSDNDIYGHVNNVAYYSFFDTAVNHYLIEQAGLDIHQGSTIALVVDSGCSYFSSISYPETIEAGIAISKLGTSSVHYQIALFKKNEEHAAAQGHFIHVYVDRQTRRPTPIPDEMRHALSRLII